MPYCNPKTALRLREALEDALKLIAHIRYQNWPSGMGAALNVVPDQFDEVLIEGERVINASKRKPRKPS